MANTPEPCDCCGNLYADPMAKDDPNYTAECMSKRKDAKWGDKNCPCLTDALWYEIDLRHYEDKMKQFDKEHLI